MAVEQNLIKSTDLSQAKVREIDFTLKFEDSLKKLIEALGVTRKVKKEAGTILKTRKATGTLQSGNVPEGEIIPLSKYTIREIDYKELTLDKHRKATTAEAIIKYGYDQAHDMTSDQMLKDITKGIRRDFFDELATGTGIAVGATLQGVLANAWGQLQVLFEDTESTPVYFVNPLDIADYLANAAITTQTAFGMKYVEDFLGLGTVFIFSDVPQGSIYATARDNIVMYYIPVNGADLGEAFDFTSDPTGYIGIHMNTKYDNMTAEDVAVDGIVFFAEMIDGIVRGTIGEAPTLKTLTVTSSAGTNTGDTAIAVTEAISAGNHYVYKVANNATSVAYGDNVASWTAWDGSADITAANGKKITIVEANSSNKAIGAGSATVVSAS